MGPVLEGAIVPEYIIKKEIFKSKLCADVTHEHREAFAFHWLLSMCLHWQSYGLYLYGGFWLKAKESS